MQAPRRPGRVITFYSYKGGTGRSMALANIAWMLACNGKRVLAIDWDLEAPGLHRYFRPFLLDAELGSSEGLIDLIDRYATAAIAPVASGTSPAPDWYLKYADFDDHVLGLDFAHFPPGGKVDLLPAGRQTDNYAVKVSSFNWQNFYDRLGGGAFLEAVKEKARAEYDYVLIDSRTGVSDTAGICTAQLPDTLVVCFTYNNQSIKGAAAVARSALAMQARLAEERAARAAPAPGAAVSRIDDTPRPYVVYPVPMRVDAGESERLGLRQAFARESFADLVSHIGPSELAEYWSGVEVPHRVFYAYEEVLATLKDDAHDPKTVLAAFLRLTSYITDRDVTDYRLPIAPELRQSLLEAFAETPLTAQAKQARAEAQRETAEQALVRNVDAAIYALEEADRGEAQSVLCRLVRLARDEEGGGAFPIRAPLADFDAAQRAVIAQLARRGVLSVNSEQRGSQTTQPPPPKNANGATTVRSGFDQSVGLADGRLVTLWPALVRWLDADREFLIWRQQLRTYLADWERSGRDTGAFLSGTLLAEAQLWLRRRAADLNDVERVYVEASAENAARYTMALTEPIQALPPIQLRAPAAAAPSSTGAPPVAMSAPPQAAAASGPRRAGGIGVVLVGAIVIAAVVAGAWWLFNRVAAPPRSAVTPADVVAANVLPPPAQPAETATPAAAPLAGGHPAAATVATTAARPPDTGGDKVVAPAEASRTQRLFVQYSGEADLRRVEQLRAGLAESLGGTSVAPAQRVDSSDAEVRYFFAEDEALAREVAARTEALLAKLGTKETLKVLRLNPRSFPQARSGNVELWLPPLEAPAAAAQPVQPTAEQKRGNEKKYAPSKAVPPAKTPAPRE
ncbi:MAG: KGGVGR-motif variant AAA ATPase [Caldimonas sp.]